MILKYILHPGYQGKRNPIAIITNKAQGPAAITLSIPSVDPSIVPVPNLVAIEEPPHRITVVNAPAVANENIPGTLSCSCSTILSFLVIYGVSYLFFLDLQ